MRRFLEDIEMYRKSCAKTIQKMNAQMEAVEQVRKQMGVFTKGTEPIRQSWAKLLASLEPMWDMAKPLKENYKKTQKYLFAEGWYLGGDMPVPNYETLAKLVDEGCHADIEEAMCEWARSKLDGIANRAETFAHRAHIIRDAIDAHRAGTYSLSIPVLFAQSDGIAYEIIGNELFRGKPLKALKDTLNRLYGFLLSELSDMLLDLLRLKSPFYTCSTKKELKCGGIFARRNGILHGSQLNYASEANSLRVIVLLGYLLDVKSLLESHPDKVAEFWKIVDEVMASNGTSDDATEDSAASGDEGK